MQSIIYPLVYYYAILHPACIFLNSKAEQLFGCRTSDVLLLEVKLYEHG